MGNPGLYDDAPAATAARPRGIYAQRPQLPEGEAPLFGAGTRDMSLNLLSESSPMDRPPTQSMSVEEPSGGLTTLAGGGGYGIEQQQQPVNPMALWAASQTPRQLQEAMTARTSQSSMSKLAGKPLPGLQQAYDRLAQQQQAAAAAAGQAQSAGALERAKAMEANQAAQEHRQVAFQADIAKERSRAEQYDVRASQLRAEVSEMKVDPENYWSSRTSGEKFGIALGVALSQFGMILSKQQGANPVLQMFERAIDRDIDAQKSNIQKKRGDLADVKGALADVYGKMGDMRSAENQTKILMMESLKSKLDVIGATTQSEVYKAAALQQSATVGERLLQLKNAAWTAERGRVTSGGSTSKPSLMQVLATQQQLMTGPTAKPLEPAPDKVIDQVHLVNNARDAVDKVYKMSRDLWTGKQQLTSWYSTKMQRFLMMSKVAMMKVRGGVESNAMAQWDAEIWNKAIKGNWDNADDVKARLLDAHTMLNSTMNNLLTAYQPKYNVGPWVAQEIKNQKRAGMIYGVTPGEHK